MTTETNDWIDAEEQKPPLNIVVRGKISDGSEKDIIFTENAQRSCFLIRGSCGMFWRSMFVRPTHWKLIIHER